MKRIVALLLACLLVFSLAACSSEKAAETETTEGLPTQGSLPDNHTPEDTTPAVTDITLKVWAPQEALGKTKKGWLPKRCEEFAEAHPQWNITWTYEACEAEEVVAKVTADPAAAADLFFYSYDELDALLKANVLADFSGEVLAQIEQDNTDAVIELFARKIEPTDEQGRQEAVYGVPYAVDTWVMYYNPTVFTAEDVKSLDAMLAKGKVAFPLTDAKYFASFYLAGGCTLFGDGTDAAMGIDFAGEKGVTVTRYLAQLGKNPNFVNDVDGAGMTGLQDGSVAAVFGNARAVRDVKAALGENWAVAAAPAITLGEQAKQLVPFYTVDAIGVNANSENSKAASLLAAYLTTPEIQYSCYKFNATVPVSVALRDGDTDIKVDKVCAAAMETAEKYAVLQPAIPEMDMYWAAAEMMAAAVVKGEISVEFAEMKHAEFISALTGAGQPTANGTEQPATSGTESTVPDAAESTVPDSTEPAAQ